MQAALESRILQLEVENTELSAAASEAAALAEEYAADAAAYRRQRASGPADAALVNELTDAARRKDRRINRLNTLLASEKDNAQRLQNKVQELTELNALADEMEETLRKSVSTLQQSLADAGGRGSAGGALDSGVDKLTDVRVHVADAVVQSLSRYFPDAARVQGDVAAFGALRSAVATLHMASSLSGKLSRGGFGAHEEDFLELFGSISLAAETAVRWCFDDAKLISTRGPSVEKELRALEEHTRTLCADFASAADVRNWADDFAHMKLDLVSMALDTLNALVPPRFERPTGAHSAEALVADITRAAHVRASEIAGSLKHCSDADKSDSEQFVELRSKLDTAKSKLERKCRELGDLRVRTSVFEERLSSTLDDAKEITALRQKVSDLEAELAASKEALIAKCGKEGAEGETREESRDRQSNDADAAVVVPRHLDIIDEAKESARLRRLLVHRHLADIQTLPLSTNVNEQLTFEKNHAVCETVRTALDNAREAASNARAIRLNADTLQPNTRGATMSRKVLLQAISLATRHLPNDNKQNRRDSAQHHVLKLSNASEEVHSVASALRQSLCL